MSEESGTRAGETPGIVLSLDGGGAAPPISEQVKRVPRSSGVYLMRDASGTVIYVGKAKDLRSRVRNYFGAGDGRAQISYLVRRIARIEVIVTDSENQAFVLERDLISKYKPRYNIRLKDDKAFLSIRIDESAPWPKLELVRRVEHDGARYFGPYSFSYELKNLLEIVKRAVPLRTCSNTVLYNRQRPCLEHQIGRCAGPCCLPVEPEKYRAWVKQAIAILEGKSDKLVKELTHHMEAASAALRFEEAANLRDRIDTLRSTKAGQALFSTGGEDRDVFAIYREERLAALTVLRVRWGRIVDTVNFSFAEVAVSDEELLSAALEQFYRGGRDMPEEIVLGLELEESETLAAYLAELRGARVEFVVPQRGIRERLLSLAKLNARQHYTGRFDVESRTAEIAKELAKVLGLKQITRRIECVDISNLQGSDIVGAVVVFFDGAPDKSSYRKYRLSFQDKPDDFAAIGEVVERRLRRGMEENDLPDLLIIDGGAVQLAKACAARDALKLSLDIVALAKIREKSRERRKSSEKMLINREVSSKKPERFYLEGRADPIELDPSHPVTHFVQRVRDEAHRFVLSYHRESRGKRVMHSVLNEIAGIGPERRRRLLKHFGSVEAIAQSDADTVARIGRMPLPLGEKILRVLGKAGT